MREADPAIEQTELSDHERSSRRAALHWIGGRWLDSGEHRQSIKPATGEGIGSYASGGRSEAELAVNAALHAFRETDWKNNRSLRARVLNAMAARFEHRAEHLALLLATEVGKILPHARFETATVPPNLRFNDWANIHDAFEEGGFKQSGRGRLRGHAGLDDFLECKHVAFKPGTNGRQ
jgi:acyl-CoA reductase-like NAD-dependent aldehyde dehydrogenase